MTKSNTPTDAAHYWAQYVQWLKRQHPSLARLLRPAASDARIQKLETALGRSLPAEVTTLWKLNDGQKDNPAGVIAGFQFLSVTEALAEWRMWEGLRSDHSPEEFKELGSLASSLPRGAIQRAYSCEGWLPLWKEPLEGNYLGVDLSPGAKGLSGQVINFGRDEDDKVVLAPSLTAVLKWLVSEAEANRLLPREDEDAGDEAPPEPTHVEGRLLTVLVKNARKRTRAARK